MKEFKRTDLPLKELPSGEILKLPVFTIEGDAPGHFIHIQAGVHGAEIQGHAVILELMKYFRDHPFKGTLQFVPLANPMALNNKQLTHTLGRFNPVNGENWNRAYLDIMAKNFSQSGFDLQTFVESHHTASWGHIKNDFKAQLQKVMQKFILDSRLYGLNDQKLLAYHLQMLAAPADIVLDLHTGPVATRYVYTPTYALESAKELAFPYYLAIDTAFAGAMDEASFMPWVTLQKAFSQAGREVPLDFESFTLELGSEEKISLSDAQNDAHRILNYLSFKNVVANTPPINKGPMFVTGLEHYVTYAAPYGGLVEYAKAPGEFVYKGEVLARYVRFSGIEKASHLDDAITEIHAHEDAIIINHPASGVVTQGMDLYQVMENFRSL